MIFIIGKYIWNKVVKMQAHTGAIFYDDDGYAVIADPYFAFEVQMGAKTKKGFGNKQTVTLDETLEQVKTREVNCEKTDRVIYNLCPELGYLKNGDYIENHINEYKEKLKKQPLNLLEKIEKVLDEADDEFEIKAAGIIEKSKIYKKILQQIFEDEKGFISVDIQYRSRFIIPTNIFNNKKRTEGVRKWDPVIEVKIREKSDRRYIDGEKEFFYQNGIGKLNDVKIKAIYVCDKQDSKYRFLLEESCYEFGENGNGRCL